MKEKERDVQDKGIGDAHLDQYSDEPTARESLKEESISVGPDYFV